MRPSYVATAIFSLVLATGPAAAVCGDGLLESGEQCDDGNRFDDDCCSAACVLLPANARCHGAVAFDPSAEFAGPFAPFVAGWDFTPTSPLTAVGLGLYDRETDGFVDLHPVGLWRASGELLASTQLPVVATAPLAGLFRYQGIPATPLEPGQRYIVAALYSQNVIEWWAEGGEVVTFDPRITFNGGREQYQVTGLQIPSLTEEQPRFGPSLLLVGQCGDAVVDGGEDCDDGNDDDSDGCSNACVQDTPTASPSITPSETATPPPTETATHTVTATSIAPLCAGDCSGDGAVRIEELILAVNIALDRDAIEECRAADRNGDGRITVDELVASVGRALAGCAE